MTATEPLLLNASELEYLLLDDLYEALDRPIDWEVHEWELQDSVIPIVDFLLAMEQERESDVRETSDPLMSIEEGLRQQRKLLYARLAELRDGLESHDCSRSTVESVRDSVLFWIHRLQNRRRDLHRLDKRPQESFLRPRQTSHHIQNSQMRRRGV